FSCYSRRTRASGHFAGHFGGIAIGHPRDEVDHAQEGAIKRPIRIGSIAAKQIQYPAILERRGAPAVLFKCCATESVEQDFKGGIGTGLVQRLALVLEDLLARHAFGLHYALLGRAVHMLNQITDKGARQQRILLFYESVSRSIGQVLDGLASENRKLTPT